MSDQDQDGSRADETQMIHAEVESTDPKPSNSANDCIAEQVNEAAQAIGVTSEDIAVNVRGATGISHDDSSADPKVENMIPPEEVPDQFLSRLSAIVDEYQSYDDDNFRVIGGTDSTGVSEDEMPAQSLPVDDDVPTGEALVAEPTDEDLRLGMEAMGLDAMLRDLDRSDEKAQEDYYVERWRKAEKSDKTKEFFCKSEENRSLVRRFGLPECGYLYQCANYVYCYDRSRRVPFWVSRYLRRYHLKGDADREICDFHREPSLPEIYQSDVGDYSGASEEHDYTRGHTVPRGDAKWDQDALDRTYNLTQIFPQNGHLNSGLWGQLERQYLKLVETYGAVVVVTVTMFIPQEYGRPFIGWTDEKGEKRSEDKEYWMSNRVLGGVHGIHGIHVPTHCAMIILVLNEPDEAGEVGVVGDLATGSDIDDILAVGAYQFPNSRIRVRDHRLSHFKVKVEDIEKNSGLLFFDELKKKKIDVDKIRHADTLPEWKRVKKEKPKKKKRRNNDTTNHGTE